MLRMLPLNQETFISFQYLFQFEWNHSISVATPPGQNDFLVLDNPTKYGMDKHDCFDFLWRQNGEENNWIENIK